MGGDAEGGEAALAALEAEYREDRRCRDEDGGQKTMATARARVESWIPEPTSLLDGGRRGGACRKVAGCGTLDCCKSVRNTYFPRFQARCQPVKAP